MKPETRSAAIIILTKNAGPEFRRTLEAIGKQDFEGRVETLVLDSGSTDGTVELAREFDVTIRTIEPGEFEHGHTRNLGALWTTGEFLVYITQDAVPADSRWLHEIVDAVASDDRIAGAYSRVLPLEDASFHVEIGVLRDLNARGADQLQGPLTRDEIHTKTPYEMRLLANFNNVSSCLRRSVWEELPFARVRWGEDLLWGKAAIEAGHAIRFASKSVVLHSHEYDLRTIYDRTRVDACMNREILGRRCVGSLREALQLTWRVSREDWRELGKRSFPRSKKLRLAGFSPVFHLVEMLGLWRGSRGALGSIPTRPVEKRRLRILMVVHSFPPYTLAGTEIYTRNLIRELAEDHDVAICHRVEDTDAENYTVRESTFDGLPVFEIVNGLEYSGIEQTYENPKIEEKFDWVLDAFRPDVVHFQHCLHLSVSLVSRTRERGLATIVHLHDYWFVCPKVQLIRPDRKVCEVREPGLACVVCSSDRSWKMRAAKLAHAIAPPVVSCVVRVYGRLARRFPRLRRRMALDAVALRRRLRTVRHHLEKADTLVSPSSFLKGRYARYGVASDKILFSRNGLAAAERLEQVERRPSKVVRFAFAGSLLWYKGVETLVRAFNTMDPERARLRIHGDIDNHPLARECYAAIEPLVQSSAIEFCGRYANEELAEIYAETDVLVVPSIWFENSPLTIQEAFASRTPVIASRLGAMQDLVRDGINGALFTPGDADDLARCVRRIVDDPSILDRWRDAIPNVKTIEENAAEIEVLYRQALMRSPRERLGTEAADEVGGSLPIRELWGSSHERHRGEVRAQGEEFALLVPNGKEPAAVSYDLGPRGPDEAVVIEVETELFEGEVGIFLAGSVRLNGSELGSIPCHAFTEEGPRQRRYRFVCRLAKRSNIVEITNAADHEDPSRPYYLRIKRVLVFRDEAHLEVTA